MGPEQGLVVAVVAQGGRGTFGATFPAHPGWERRGACWSILGRAPSSPRCPQSRSQAVFAVEKLFLQGLGLEKSGNKLLALVPGSVPHPDELGASLDLRG